MRIFGRNLTKLQTKSHRIILKDSCSNPLVSPIVVLASGNGSNFEALYRATQEGKLSAQIRAVLCDRAEAKVLQKAAAFGIPAIHVPYQKREEHGKLLLEHIQRLQPQFVVLAGYMRILSASFIEALRSPQGYSRIINVHPSLLPAFPGMNSYAQAYQYGVKTTGVSVHLVEEGVDLGPICAQQAFSIEDCNSEEEVMKKGLAIEHRLFPETLEWILKGQFTFEARPSGRHCVRKN